jgi:hypothetical protein
MADSYIKIDNSTIKKTSQKEEVLNIDMLKKRKEMLDAELARVNEAIAQALLLGVIPRV